jgi:predicted secreted hydrolase
MSTLKQSRSAALAVIASEDADYERLGLARDVIAPWEDGARTDNRRGTYEWWYFDARLDDGSSLVVTFMNKDLASPNDPLTPTIRIDLDLADGRSIQKLATYPPDSWRASTAGADVRIGENRFSGDLHSYRIVATVEEIAIDVTLVGDVPPWRPQTGYLLYGAKRDMEFAWLPSVPLGAVTATYRIGDEAHQTTGVGYHDHNWGNASLQKLVHDWYWARGQAGPYSVIASIVTAHERYDYTELPLFMLATLAPRPQEARSDELVSPCRWRVDAETSHARFTGATLGGLVKIPGHFRSR